MFNNGTGHHIHGGHFYNASGDVNLQSLQTHLTIQNRLENPQPLAGSALGLEDGGGERSPQQRTIQNHEAGSEWEGFVRSARRRQEMSNDGSFSTQPMENHRRLKRQEGIKVCKFHSGATTDLADHSKNLRLIREIGSGPGYFLPAGQNKGRAVIVKVFNRGPTVRQQLEATVALSKGIMHPNVLRLLGISSPVSSFHFIVYETFTGRMPQVHLQPHSETIFKGVSLLDSK